MSHRSSRWYRAEEELVARMPEELRTDLAELKKNEDRLVQVLQNEQEKKSFFEDPIGFLERHDIRLSPTTQTRLRAAQGFFNELAKPEMELHLPNGQVLKPRVNIRFVTRERD